MGKRKSTEPRPQGAPMWIVTFTDMTSLLLTFFIMMLTFSSMEDEKLRRATGSLSGAFGAMTPERKRARTDVNPSLDIQFRKQDKDGPSESSMRKETVTENIKKIQDRQLFNVKLDMSHITMGTKISIQPTGSEELFVLGTNRVGQSTTIVLREIARMFSTLPVRIVVETHCDSELPRSLLMEPIDLTMLNGLAAAEILIDAGMIPERVGVSPRGDAAPVAGNDTAMDRFRNRRLEILVIPDERDEAFGYSGD